MSLISLSKLQKEVLQFSLLILMAIGVWMVVHRTPSVNPDVYPYLSKISPDLVEQCVSDKRQVPAISWEQLLAIRSTLTNDEAESLMEQLRKQKSFSNLNWGLIPSSKQKTVQRHVEILKHYPVYQPNKYQFPVSGTVWFEDSFGADREGGIRRHEGTDLFGNEGTPIISCCGGVIEQLGWNRLGGERVGVRGDDGNYYYYAHLQDIASSLIKGNRIEAGDVVGSMGHTGDALTTPDHLHFGIELPSGEWINPYPFLKVWQSWANFRG